MSKPNPLQKQNIPTKIASFTLEKRNKNPLPRQQLKQLINDSIASQSQMSNSMTTQQDIQNQGKTKLIQLTRQCSHYFQKFTSQNDNHIKIIMNIFSQFSHQIEETFHKIMKSVQDKLQQIKSYLKRQENRLIDQRKQQQQSLNILLMKIHTVHLTKIEESTKATNEHLTEYAFTLNQFFNKMEEIQCKINEDNIEESINFVNSLTKDQLITIIASHFGCKVTDKHEETPVSAQNYFTFEKQSRKYTQESNSSLFYPSATSNKCQNNSQLLEQLEKIKQSQMLRQERLKFYNQYLEGNPFSYIKIRQ